MVRYALLIAVVAALSAAGGARAAGTIPPPQFHSLIDAMLLPCDLFADQPFFTPEDRSDRDDRFRQLACTPGNCVLARTVQSSPSACRAAYS